MFPDVLVAAFPPIVTAVTARLSVTTAVMITLSVLSEVLRATEFLLLETEVITGLWSSVFVIVTVNC